MFQSIEFYNYASRLYESSKSNSEEVIVRTVIGRSYYAAFLEARGVSGLNDHSGVHDYFSGNHATLGNRLKELKLLRHKADYKLDKICTVRDMERALKYSEKILEELSNIE